MSLRIVQLGSPRHPDEGTRIGTVRRPPRGVPKTEFASRDYYDVWLPLLSPEPDTIKQAQSASDAKSWNRFVKAFERELARPEAARTLELLAKLSHSGDFSVGCYCEDASRCHRSVLESTLRKLGAKLA